MATTTGIKLVANGELWPTEPGTKVHCVDLQPGCVKVTIVVVSNKARNLLLPVPSDEFQTLGQAENNQVQWPEKLVKILNKVLSYLF